MLLNPVTLKTSWQTGFKLWISKALFDVARIYSANVIDIDTIDIPACSDKYKTYITGYVHPKANYMKAIADKCYKSMINMVFME